MKYLYIPEERLEVDRLPPVEFEQNHPNQILAWREAEQRFGKGGRLFKEVVLPPSPWGGEVQKKNNPPSGKIPVLHR